MRRGLAAPVVVLVVVLAVGVAGCGNDTRSAADRVPALSGRLSGIEHAVAAHRYALARDRLDALVHETSDARAAGQLDGATADRILAAAAQLLTVMPTPAPTPTTPTATPTTPKPTVAKKPAPPHHAPKPPKKHDHGHHGKGPGDG